MRLTRLIPSTKDYLNWLWPVEG